jgi:hypothetical protein
MVGVPEKAKEIKLFFSDLVSLLFHFPFFHDERKRNRQIQTLETEANEPEH